MSKKSNRAFNAIKYKWHNDDDRQEKMLTRKIIKHKKRN